MRGKTTIAILLLVGTIWAATASAFNEPDEFMGVKWGTACEDTRSTIVTRLTEKSKERVGGTVLTFLAPSNNGNISRGCSPSSNLGPRRYNLAFQDIIGTALISVLLKFLDNKFEAAELKFKPHSYGGIFKAFSAKYGEPDAVENSVVKNQMGAEFENQTAVWTGKQISIIMKRLATKIDEGDAHIITQRWRESLAESIKDAQEKAVKDF